MRNTYDAKIADIESFLHDTHDADRVDTARATMRQRLDWVDQQLSGRLYCCGETYTAADVVWTVTVARQHMLGSNPCEGRPALQAWFRRMQTRPSYKKADVWARFKPEVMLAAIISKFKWQVFTGLITAALLTAGVMYWLSGSS